MVIEHAFYKNCTESTKQTNKRFFEELGPVSQREMNKYEAPIQSIRRILGDNFYDLENKKDDLVQIKITNNGVFSFESIKADTDLGSFDTMNSMSPFIVSLFSKFAQAFGNTIISPDFAGYKFKVAVTSPKGVICKELCITDFAPLSSFDDSGNVVGFKDMTEINTITNDLIAADEAAKKLNSTGGASTNAATIALTDKINKLNDKLISKHLGLIETFLNLVKLWGEVDNVADVWNVTFIFNDLITDNSAVNENEIKQIAVVDVYSLHDISHLRYTSLKSKFE